jgi:hypothetical protein
MAGAGELEYMCFDPEHVNSPSLVGWLESKLSIDYLSERFGFDRNQRENSYFVL